MSEQSKYEQLWAEHKQYRRVAPGEYLAEQFLDLAKPRQEQVVYDFGCGTGRGAARIGLQCRVVGFDFAANCLDAGIDIEFRQHDLTTPLDMPVSDFGFSTDVLEHIEPDNVDRVLLNIGAAARRVYLNISTVPDAMGALIGEPLHLTVESAFWWHDKLVELGFRVDWSHYDEHSATFYCSAWASGQDFEDISILNVTHERVISNIKANLSLGLREIAPHKVQPDKVIRLLAGGPSLADAEDEILVAGRDGEPIVTVNGTYGWLLERGVKPAAMVMVDARDWNKRFLTQTVDTCKYLMGSQCDHEVVASLPREQTWLWHSSGSELVKQAVNEWTQENGGHHQWYPVAGASTVVTRAITLLAMLGYRKVEIFGWDSCLRDDKHHAYEQPENNGRGTVPVTVGGRTFTCHPWMVVQASEVVKLIRHVWSAVPDLELSVRGDGLIAAMLNTAGESNGC
jgi:SAM-dependent methyltransferase